MQYGDARFSWDQLRALEHGLNSRPEHQPHHDELHIELTRNFLEHHFSCTNQMPSLLFHTEASKREQVKVPVTRVGFKDNTYRSRFLIEYIQRRLKGQDSGKMNKIDGRRIAQIGDDGRLALLPASAVVGDLIYFAAVQ